MNFLWLLFYFLITSNKAALLIGSNPSVGESNNKTLESPIKAIEEHSNLFYPLDKDTALVFLNYSSLKAFKK